MMAMMEKMDLIMMAQRAHLEIRISVIFCMSTQNNLRKTSNQLSLKMIF